MNNLSSESKSLHFLWGGLAFAIYFGLIGLLFIYFNSRSVEQPKHFVKKDEKRIQLATSAPVKAIKVKTIIEKPKIKPKKELPLKVKPKSIEKPKIKPIKKKTVIQEKVIKKKMIQKKDENITRTKKPKLIKVKKTKKAIKPKKIKKIKKIKKPNIKKTSDLFSSVQTVKKVEKNKISIINKSQSASKKINDTIKEQKQSDSGIENAYFAKVQSLLETWPAQSDYAGEKAMVRIYVKPTGMFEFKVKSQSENVDFNLGLIDFLMQLQRIGLGKHTAGKTYEFEVEFIAKE